MPHRVADFFRSSISSPSLDSQIPHPTQKSASSQPFKSSRSRRSRKPLERLTSTLLFFEGGSGGGDDDSENATPDDTRAPPAAPSLKMADSRASSLSSESHKDHGHHHHYRISLSSMHFGRSHKESHVSMPAMLTWELESPPAVMYGEPETSSGALVSGQLYLDVKEDFLEVYLFFATLNLHVVQKKPFGSHCSECANQYTEIKRWDLLPHPLVLTKGIHTFPVSVLLEGHLPASMDTPLVSIAYEFKAEVHSRSKGSSLPPIKLEKVWDVKRSLATSETPHHSVRVFPPTNIKASAHYPHVVHPIGSNTLSLRLDGIAKHNSKVNTIEYWKLKKLTWKLEETIKTVAPACGRHSPRATDSSDDGHNNKKGVVRAETRVIGEKTLFSGWKSNYTSATDSLVELELDYSLTKGAKYACDTRSRDGTEVTHQLMIEMVVSQEWAPVNRPSLVTHTGVGRILRMHFGTILTERAGIGISWDNEAPPIYQDVPPSPPAYCEGMAMGVHNIAETVEPPDRRSQQRSDSSTPRSSADSSHSRVTHHGVR